MAKKIAIIAGEKSGEIIGAKLIESLKAIYPGKINFIGVGGSQMLHSGVESLFPLEDLSVMGFVEVIPKLAKILSRINQTIEYIKNEKPDILITIDAPSFNFRVAKALKNQNIKLVHYVAPTVWAYKASRAKKFAEIYDLMLTLWPFEPHYFTRYGLKSFFVGNCFLEDLPMPNRENFRLANNISLTTTLICVMPGGRKCEIERILPCFSKTLKILHHKIYDMVAVIPIASENLSALIKENVKNAPYRIIFVDENKDRRSMFAASDLALIKSGTSTIEVASSLTPMVIGYIANPISVLIAKIMVKIRYINIINIIKNREIIPEFIQSRCRPDYLAKALYELHINRDKAKLQMDESLQVLKEIGLHFEPKPSLRAAQHIVNLLESK